MALNTPDSAASTSNGAASTSDGVDIDDFFAGFSTAEQQGADSFDEPELGTDEGKASGEGGVAATKPSDEGEQQGDQSGTGNADKNGEGDGDEGEEEDGVNKDKGAKHTKEGSDDDGENTTKETDKATDKPASKKESQEDAKGQENASQTTEAAFAPFEINGNKFDSPEDVSAFVKKVRTDFPEMDTVAQLYAQELTRQQQAYAGQLAQLSTKIIRAEVKQTHNDLDDIEGKVFEWVDSQPKPIAKAYVDMLQSGDVKNINQVIGWYKEKFPGKKSAGETATPANPKPTTNNKNATKEPAKADSTKVAVLKARENRHHTGKTTTDEGTSVASSGSFNQGFLEGAK